VEKGQRAKASMAWLGWDFDWVLARGFEFSVPVHMGLRWRVQSTAAISLSVCVCNDSFSTQSKVQCTSGGAFVHRKRFLVGQSITKLSATFNQKVIKNTYIAYKTQC